MTQRCGKCQNCRALETVKGTVLACCGTPPKREGGQFNHADDGVVQVWNDSLKRYPCTGVNDDKRRDSALQNL